MCPGTPEPLPRGRELRLCSPDAGGLRAGAGTKPSPYGRGRRRIAKHIEIIRASSTLRAINPHHPAHHAHAVGAMPATHMLLPAHVLLPM